MIIKIFGDALFYPHTTEALKEFPSPEDLKGRIVISTKPPKEYLEAAPVAKTAAQNKQVVKELQKEDKQTAPLSDKVGNLHLNEVIIFEKTSVWWNNQNIVLHTGSSSESP
jgi:hypothetical protein